MPAPDDECTLGHDADAGARGYRVKRDARIQPGRTLLMTCLAIFAGSLAVAQEPVHDELKPVEAYVEDTSALSTSLRDIQYGLQVPYGFDQLMQEDRPGGRYIRRAAGLWAIFPRSVYGRSEGGYVATIAPGTIFCIGEPPRSNGNSSQQARPTSERHSQAFEAEAVIAEPSDGYSETPGPQPSSKEAPPPFRQELVQVRFLVDEEYRRDRMLSLVLRSRSQAARGPSSSGSK